MANKHLIIPLQQTVRQVRRDLKHVANETVQYEAVLDYDELHALARKAAVSRSQTAKAGPITVRILQRAEHPVEEKK